MRRHDVDDLPKGPPTFVDTLLNTFAFPPTMPNDGENESSPTRRRPSLGLIRVLVPEGEALRLDESRRPVARGLGLTTARRCGQLQSSLDGYLIRRAP